MKAKSKIKIGLKRIGEDNRLRVPRLLVTAAATVGGVWSAHASSFANAASLYWGGGNGSWNLTTNWSTVSTATTPNPAVLPTAADDAVFNITPSNTLSGNITVDAFQFVNSMTIATSGTTTFTAGLLNGANPFFLNLGNIVLSTSGLTVAPGAGKVSFGDGITASNDAALAIQGRNTWTNQSSSNVILNLAAATSFARGVGSTINFNQSGTGRFIAPASVLQNTNAMVGAWAFFGNPGAGTLRYVTNSSGTLATYSGATVVADASGITDTTGTVNYEINTVATATIPGAVSFNTLRYTAGSATITHNGISLNGILNTGGNSFIITGTAASPIGSSKELVINCDKSNSGVTLNTGFTNNAGGASSIIKTGAGPLTVGVAQTFTGGFYVTQGTVTTTKGVVASPGTLAISAGASLTNNASGQSIGALIGAGNFTHIGTSSNTDTLTIGNNNTGGQFDGNITNTSSTRLLTVTKVGSGAQIFTGTNGYGGNTTVSGSGGILLVTRPSALSAYTVPGRVAILNGFLAFRVGDGTTGFTTTQIDTVLANASKATTNSPGIGIDTTNGDVTQWGLFNIPNNFGFAKYGPGTFTFNEANPLTGNILIRTGTVTFSGTASYSQTASGSTTLGVGGVSGGVLNYNSSAASTFGNITVGNGTVSQSTFTQTGGTITATSLTLNGGLSGVGQGIFNLTGGTFNVGTVTASGQVAGDNIFSDINVSGGSLNVSGALYLTGAPAAGRNGAGRVNQTGGTVSASGSGLVLARTTAANASARRGEYNLNGGLLIATALSLQAGTDTFGTFNFNGGVLQAAADAASFMNGLTRVNVRDGGANIDPAGFSVTVGQAIQHSAIAGDHAIDGGLTVSGGGTVTLTGALNYTGNTTASGTGANLKIQPPLRPVTGSLVVTGPGATVSLETPASASSYAVIGEVTSISVTASGSSVSIPIDTSRSSNKARLMIAGGLSVTGGLVDIGDGDLIVRNSSAAVLGSLAATGSLIASGASTATFTGLAVFSNDAGGGVPYFSSYDGTSVAAGDTIVRYDYLGDTDLNGVITGADLAKVVEGYSTGQSGWAWGDYNYDGVVSAAEVGKIFEAYTALGGASLGNGQGGNPEGGTVPEPAGMGVLFGVVALNGRRRRQ